MVPSQDMDENVQDFPLDLTMRKEEAKNNGVKLLPNTMGTNKEPIKRENSDGEISLPFKKRKLHCKGNSSGATTIANGTIDQNPIANGLNGTYPIAPVIANSLARKGVHRATFPVMFANLIGSGAYDVDSIANDTNGPDNSNGNGSGSIENDDLITNVTIGPDNNNGNANDAIEPVNPITNDINGRDNTNGNPDDAKEPVQEKKLLSAGQIEEAKEIETYHIPKEDNLRKRLELQSKFRNINVDEAMKAWCKPGQFDAQSLAAIRKSARDVIEFYAQACVIKPRVHKGGEIIHKAKNVAYVVLTDPTEIKIRVLPGKKETKIDHKCLLCLGKFSKCGYSAHFKIHSVDLGLKSLNFLAKIHPEGKVGRPSKKKRQEESK